MPDDRKIFTVLERSLITRGLGTVRSKLVYSVSSSYRPRRARISPLESLLRGYTCTTRTDLWIRGGFCRGRSLMTRKERAVAFGTRGGRDGSSSVRAVVPFARLVGLMSVAVAVPVSNPQPSTPPLVSRLLRNHSELAIVFIFLQLFYCFLGVILYFHLPF